jgi:hypothetical protein
VSDIGILSDPLSLVIIAFLFGWPGLLLGGIPGALLWWRHRVAGGLLGAIAGFIMWPTGLMLLKDVI